MVAYETLCRGEPVDECIVKPILHERERGGEHVRFMAGVRSRIAKQRGDAISDVPGADLDKAPRRSAPASPKRAQETGE